MSLTDLVSCKIEGIVCTGNQITNAAFETSPAKTSLGSEEEFLAGIRRKGPRLSRGQASYSLEFDELFEHPDQLSASIRRQTYVDTHGDSIDEGIASLEIDTDVETPSPRASVPTVKLPNGGSVRPSVTSAVSRADSVMELTFLQILAKNWEHSQGFCGFRRRIATDINFKYCSYCRCDDVLFLFLYTLFGIAYICAGTLGFYNCTGELAINVYLVADGVLSIFVFPTTIMEWTKRIGGCVNADEKLDRGVFFITIAVTRMIAGVVGTIVLALRYHLVHSNDVMCFTIFTLLHVGVVLEWAFLFLAVMVPTCFYMAVYGYSKRWL